MVRKIMSEKQVIEIYHPVENSQNYKCEDCGKVYINKNSYYKHRKTNCSELIFDDNAYICEKCGKQFKLKNSYYVHCNRYCKVMKQEKQKEQFNLTYDEYLKTNYDLLKCEDKIKQQSEKIHQQSEKINQQSEKFEQMIEENNQTKSELEDKIKELADKLNDQLTSISSQHHHTNNNATNQINQTGNGNQAATVINNISFINNFGSEDLSKITPKEVETIVATEFNMISNLIKHIHIDTPENRNIYIPSLKEKHAMVKKDDKWELVNRNTFVNRMIVDKSISLEEMIDKNGEQFEKINPNRSIRVLRHCTTDDKEIKRHVSQFGARIMSTKEFVNKLFPKQKQRITSKTKNLKYDEIKKINEEFLRKKGLL